jgi:hypothetical protein
MMTYQILQLHLLPHVTNSDFYLGIMHRDNQFLPVSEFVTFATDDTSEILCSLEMTISGSNSPSGVV